MISSETRHLLLGDWNRVVRDPLDLLRAMFAVAAIVYAMLGLGGGRPMSVLPRSP